MDDEELIRAALNNESYAGPFLISLYGPKLAGYCRSIASDLSDTDREHAIANGIERAVRRIDSYDPALGSLVAWFRPFVRHAVQDWRRSNTRLSKYDLADLKDMAEDETPALSPALLEAIDAVKAALPRLSVPDQILIVLRNYEMHSVQETAAILKINADACRQRHHRALVRLKALLEADARVQRVTGGSQ